MDFSWTKEQDELYTRTLAGVQAQLKRAQRETCWTPVEWRLCGSLGLLGLCVPEGYGGAGHGALTTARALEAFGYACEDHGLVFSVAAQLFACTMPLVEYGTPEVRNQFLPGLCSGELIGANGITEREAGSDIFALETRARRAGDAYILTGTKSYVSNGPLADLFVVYASTNPAHGYLGITAFVLEKNTPGLVPGEPLEKMGLNSTPACPVHLHECSVPVTQRLGKEGEGAQIFKRSMLWERSCLFATYVGQMERQLEQTIAFTRQRRQFGRSLSKNQAVAHRLVEMKLRLEASRLLLYQACWLLDQGKPATLAISLSKLAISESAVQGGLDAIRLHGSLGIARDYGIEAMLRDALPGTIFSGTSEMQRDIIAGELGL